MEADTNWWISIAILIHAPAVLMVMYQLWERRRDARMVQQHMAERRARYGGGVKVPGTDNVVKLERRR